jgi:cytochrome b561
MTTIAAPPFRASRYTTGAILLHWTIALLILAQLGGGYAMMHLLEEGTALQFQVYQLHKSIGIAILVLTVSRILWRVFNPPPPEPASVSRVEGWVAHVVHYLFYVLLLAVPLAGWLLITVSPVQIETVLFFVDRLPWPHLPGFEAMTPAARAELTEGTEWVHAVLAYAMGGLVALHVAGALKHQLQDRRYLSRMSVRASGDGPRNSYGHATTWLTTLVFFGAMVGAATWARMEPSAVAGPATVSPDAAEMLGTAAEAPAPAETAGAPVTEAPLWAVDPAGSRVGFSFAFTGRPVEGTFARFDPTIRFSRDDLEGSSIAVAIDTASATAGPGVSAQQLTGPDGFAVADFPTATFSADTIRADGDRYLAEGTLAIRDREVPVTLPFTVTIDGDTARASGSVTVDRTAFGIGASSDPSGSTLGKDVTISVDILASRAGDTESAAAPEPGAATWTVAPEVSSVGFVFEFQGSRVTGAIQSFASEIRLDPDNLDGAAIDVSLDLSSATVEGRAVTETQLRGPDGLAVETDRLARFRSDDITRRDDGTYLARGELTLRGVTAAVELPFTLEIIDGRGVADGTLTIDRKTFGIGEENDPTGRWIAPTVEVAVHIVAFAPGVTPAVLR